MSIQPGQLLQHYRLIEKIGEGGMGVVWKAEDTRLHRNVAMKFVPEDAARDQQFVDRHMREARAASAMNHPHICSIHDVGEWEGRQFIVMELLEGLSVQQRIKGAALPIADAVELTIQIADALDTAHAKGIIHRDIKTANLFITERGQAKVLDFGLAKLITNPELELAPDAQTLTAADLTATGAVVGTVAYMSPEQALGKSLDHRTDLFSLGAVLYEMITGRRAFAGATSAAVYSAILNEVPPPLMELNREVPAELQRVVNKSLEKDPELRYQSAAELRSDLLRLQRDSFAERTSTSTPLANAGAGRHRIRLLAGAGLVAVVAVLLLKGVFSRDTIPVDATPGSQVDVPATRVSSRGPTIDVLPFTNASGDTDQEYFSSGLTGDIVTELSRYNELSVIAYSSAESYQDGDVATGRTDVPAGSRYLLRGTVRKVEQEIRVSVQLSDSDDGRLVWGTNYERNLTARDLFDLQDELTQQVVNAIAGSYGALTRAALPGARRKPPANLDSYDCVLRAYEYLHVHTPAKHLAARECLTRVVAADPDYADGLAWLAYMYSEEVHHRWNEREDEAAVLERALNLAEEAVRLDAVNHVAHGALALTHFVRGEYERAKIEAYRTIDLAPNNTAWLAMLAFYLAQREDFEHSLEMVRKAVALDPHPVRWVRTPFFIYHYRQGRYEEALAELREIEMGADDFRGPLYLAAVYGQLDRSADAAPALDRLVTLFRQPIGELHRELTERHALTPALAGHLLEGLTKAGMEGVVNPPEATSSIGN